MEKDIKILEKAGWHVICESPLEIEYLEDGHIQGFASGCAADLILIYLKISPWT